MVAEVVEGTLRPHAADRREQLDALSALVLSVFDRYPVPPRLARRHGAKRAPSSHAGCS